MLKISYDTLLPVFPITNNIFMFTDLRFMFMMNHDSLGLVFLCVCFSADDVTFMTLGISIVFIIVIGYMMRTLSSVEEDRLNSTRRQRQRQERPRQQEKSHDPEPVR